VLRGGDNAKSKGGGKRKKQEISQRRNLALLSDVDTIGDESIFNTPISS
jgi:hypothetical protein